MKPTHEFEVSVENYLKAVWDLTEQKLAPVTNKALCSHLRVKAPSVTRMVQKLERLGLAKLQSGTICLSAAGRRRVVSLIRRHRSVEMFLAQTLKLDVMQAHEYAELLEHAVSESLAERMLSFLRTPSRDYQGMKIPKAATPHFRETRAPRLSQQRSGRMLRIRALNDHNPSQLQACLGRGLRVGQKIRVQSRSNSKIRCQILSPNAVADEVELPLEWADCILVETLSNS